MIQNNFTQCRYFHLLPLGSSAICTHCTKGTTQMEEDLCEGLGLPSTRPPQDRGRSKAWFSGCSATREGVLGIFSIEKSTTFVQGRVNSFISLLPTIHFLLLSKGSGGDLSNGRAWTPERGHLWNTPVGTSHSGCLRNAGLLLDLFLASARTTKKNHAHTHTKEKTNKKNPAHWFCN